MYAFLARRIHTIYSIFIAILEKEQNWRMKIRAGVYLLLSEVQSWTVVFEWCWQGALFQRSLEK